MIKTTYACTQIGHLTISSFASKIFPSSLLTVFFVIAGALNQSILEESKKLTVILGCSVRRKIRQSAVDLKSLPRPEHSVISVRNSIS
jgi:hypothetical protein